MALSITPGYDFSPQEVPTRSKFLQAATGLGITGIPLDRIEGTIQAIVFGDVTGASGGAPSSEGWLWVDPAGHRVGRPFRLFNFNRVDVRVWSAQGGWETVLFRTRGFMAGHAIGYGRHMWHLSAYEAAETRRDMDLNETPWGVSAHSVDSPASSIRLVVRGLCTALTSAQATEIHLRTRRPGILTDASGQEGWRVLNQFDGFKAHFAGTVMGFADGSTLSTADGHDAVWPETAAWFTMRNLGRS